MLLPHFQLLSVQYTVLYLIYVSINVLMYIYNNLSYSKLILHLQICLPHRFTTEPLNDVHLTITSHVNTVLIIWGTCKHRKLSTFHQLVQTYGWGRGSRLLAGRFYPPKCNHSCGAKLCDACCSTDEQLCCTYCGNQVNAVWY